jgi:hypothetical protein
MKMESDRRVVFELKALRKLRMAVGKMMNHINQGDEHPIDRQRVEAALAEAEKAECRRILV